MSDFKVAIVGGGLAGLATALHLEKLGIDWILIEAHPIIAPELGASIGLAPNGMVILDQLGCLADVEARSTACKSVRIHDGASNLLSSFPLDPIRKVHGYDLSFTERRIILEILHDHIKAKEKIFTGQKVDKIEHTEDGVKLTTREGKTFEADVVVGADGIHSPVRKQMWQAAWDDGSDVFPKNVGEGEFSSTSRSWHGVGSDRLTLLQTSRLNMVAYLASPPRPTTLSKAKFFTATPTSAWSVPS